MERLADGEVQGKSERRGSSWTKAGHQETRCAAVKASLPLSLSGTAL